MKKLTLSSYVLYSGSGSPPTIEYQFACPSSVVKISETEIEASQWKDVKIY